MNTLLQGLEEADKHIGRETTSVVERFTGEAPLAVPRRAKIVCTLGPATASPERIAGLVAAGMDVARLNFSHADHAFHAEAYGDVRALPTPRAEPSACMPICKARSRGSAAWSAALPHFSEEHGW